MKQTRRARDAQAKAKRQKIKVGAGLGILALVLAIQVPKVMKLISPGGERAAAASAAPASTTPEQAPSPAVRQQSPAVAQVKAEADAPHGPLFDRFSTKDPFAPQLVDAAEGQPAGTATASAAESGAVASAATTPRASTVGNAGGDGTGSLVPAPATSTATAGGAPSATTMTMAAISINGATSHVSLGDVFPASDPVFRLAALGRASAKVSIAGGSYASGAKAVKIPLHGTLTLLNTATGVRYRLQLLSLQ